MPETSKLEKLNWELEKSEKKLRKAINDEKALQYQLKQLMHPAYIIQQPALCIFAIAHGLQI